jgi:peptidoglycan DL-endopeptidase LytE
LQNFLRIEIAKGAFMMGRWTFFRAGFLVLAMTFGFSMAGLAEERYTVKSGDTLYELSKSFGVTIEAIRKANHLESDSLRLKQVLVIPVQKKRPAEETAGRLPAETEKYVVSKGDTLHSIAKKTGVSVEEIKGMNRLPSPALKVGQVLVLQKNSKAEEIEDELGDAEEVSPEPVAKKEDGTREALDPVGKWNGSDERNLFIRVVKNFLGVPYRLGGSTLKGLDCSAFVKRIYEIFNVYLPRTAREQFRFGKKIEKNQLEEGDLVFFKTRRGENGHVGIYIGNNEFVHASFRSKEVKIDNLDTPYFSQRFNRGVRVKEIESETHL